MTNDCARIREGGQVLETIELDRSCFAAMLGGPDRRTLFMLTAEWAAPKASMRSSRLEPDKSSSPMHLHRASAGRDLAAAVIRQPATRRRLPPNRAINPRTHS